VPGVCLLFISTELKKIAIKKIKESDSFDLNKII